MKLHRFRAGAYMGLAMVCSSWGLAQSKPAQEAAAPRRLYLQPVPSASATAKTDPPIAVVNGEPVYKQELEVATAARMLQIHQEEYKIQMNGLESLIRQKLVEQEAKKQGIPVDKLYEKEVDSKVPDPSEAELKGYYLALKNQIHEPFDKIEPQLSKVVKAMEVKQAREKYADSLRANADVTILLQPPPVEVGPNDPARTRGNPDAPITIVEFGDYQCPFCSQAESTLTDLFKKYNGKLKLAFRDFPLSSIHPFAQEAAEASRCAEAQGKFWPMHDAIYANQSKLTEADLIQTAGSLGVDQKSFAACLKSGAYQAAIQQDIEAGERAGVTGTPAFFINGRFVDGAVPEAQFEQIIDSELASLK
jgi:protein-disulfide isomerase